MTTDHYAVVNPEDLTPVVQPVGPFTCPTCGKEFETHRQMTGHQNAHAVRKGKRGLPKGHKKCPECGKFFYPTSLWRHRQTQHGATDPDTVVEVEPAAKPPK